MEYQDARVRASEPCLQQLLHACDDAASNEFLEVEARGSDGVRVCAAHAVNPLHGQDPCTAEIPPDPWDLHFGVIQEIPVEILRSGKGYRADSVAQGLKNFIPISRPPIASPLWRPLPTYRHTCCVPLKDQDVTAASKVPLASSTARDSESMPDMLL